MNDDLISRQAAIDTLAEWQDPAITNRLNNLASEDAVSVVRCKDCKHRRVNEHYGEKGYLNLKAMCDLDTGDIFELGRNAENDDWYCADAERKEGEH